MHSILRILIVFLAPAFMFASAYADTGAPLTPAAKAEAIQGVCKQLTDRYVFPDVAAKIVVSLNGKLSSHAYDQYANPTEFADAVTADMRAIAHDQHLKITYSEKELIEDSGPQHEPTPEEGRNYIKARFGSQNYGIERVDTLPGNVGYLKVNALVSDDVAHALYGAVMGVLGNTDALIIDLRDNSGAIGLRSTEALLSYFLDDKTHISDIYWREGDRTTETWSIDKLAAPKYLGKPIYVLTSGFTFSGAEGFSYALKNLGRATLVGEHTRGGANPGGPVRASAHFDVWVPIGRAISPITHRNWDGEGVQPDVPVNAEKALYVAHNLALKTLEAKSSPDQKTTIENAIRDNDYALSQFRKMHLELKAPSDAKQVAVTGDFNFWGINATPMEKKQGVWAADVEVMPGRYSYRFEVDGQHVLDPANSAHQKSAKGEVSVLVVN